MKINLVLLPGDGIGPEVVDAASAVIVAMGKKFNHSFEMHPYLIGGIAMDKAGNSLPPETVEACQSADAVLLGAVGGPKWDNPKAADRPERGLLAARKALELYANLRPVRLHPALMESSPVRTERLQGVDLIVVRELTGGVYFGEPRWRKVVNGQDTAVDTMIYTEKEVRRVAVLAFDLARQRKHKVTSVDKANVLESSRLWREITTDVAKNYPDVALEHLLVDAASMHLITRPASFDVMLTENLFGDILSDESSVLTGSMGNMPSASLGAQTNRLGKARGLYEPIHGSAPDIAGKGIANPIGTILSVAMLLRHSCGLDTEAEAIERAVDAVLNDGMRTADLVKAGEKALSTVEMQAAIIDRL